MNRPVHGGNLAWAAASIGCLASDIVDFSASINPHGPPSSAIAAIQESLTDLIAYPDPNYSQLRQALAARHQIEPEWILPGNGSAELLTWAAWDLSSRDVTYLICPAFADYWRALKAFKVNVEPWQLSLENYLIPSLNFNLEKGTHSRGLLLNNPHNPTGKLWTRENILPYLERFDSVVVDEAFMDFLEPDRDQSLIGIVQDYPNLTILRSLTKFYSLPGLRLGYAIAHPDLLKVWQERRDPWPVNILAVAAAMAAIVDRSFEQQTWQWLSAARQQLYDGLNSISGLQPLPSSVNFFLVRTEIPSSQLQELLLRNYRLLIRDCLSFPELGDLYFRVAVRSREDNQYLLQALHEI
jgi:L-threonine-O-3-phosphate decarboxylase